MTSPSIPLQPLAAALALAYSISTGHAQNVLSAYVQNATQTGTANVMVDLSAAAARTGPLVPLSTSGTGTSPLVVYNWNPAIQLKRFYKTFTLGTGRIVMLGDSTTRGAGASDSGWTGLSTAAELARFLTLDGIPAQSDNFLGQGMYGSTYDTDLRLSFVGHAGWGPSAAGGSVVQTTQVGDGLSFALNTPGNYNRVSVSYLDIGIGTISIAVDGGPAVATVQIGTTGNTISKVVSVPAGLHSSLQILQVGSSPTFIQGAAFFRRSAGIRVENAGIGGWTAATANTSYCNGGAVTATSCGFGATSSLTSLGSTLVLVNLGINDLLHGGSPSSIAANIAGIIKTLRQAGSDVILVVPTPFADASYAQMPELQADLRQLAKRTNVPLFDLSATYVNSAANLYAQGLMSGDVIHPDATLYADIANAIANQIVGAIEASAAAD